jgi:hypothetical protein
MDLTNSEQPDAEQGLLSPSRHFAQWLTQTVRSPELAALLPREELEHFLASTGYRTKGILALQSCLPGGGTLIDHGTSFGLMPWLIAVDATEPPDHVVMIDPLARYESALQRLWTGPKLPSNQFVQSSSENYYYDRGADLILFCHTLFRIPRNEWQSVLERAWNALNPGGALVVNETLSDKHLSSTGIELSAISSLLDGFDRDCVTLYRPETRWSVPENPLTTAGARGSSCFLVTRKTRS